MLKYRLRLLIGVAEGQFFHLSSHQGEGVGSSGREMLLETGLIDEGHIGLKNVVGFLFVEDSHKERDHAFGDEAVGVCFVFDEAVLEGGIQPDLGLAAFDDPVRGLKLWIHGRQFFTEINYILVTLGPILEEVELVEELLLLVGNGHRAREIT